ncbi:hypothetical protein KDX26_25965, partial [Burkholderia cenocepacia]|uniref:hypothetical protein n=1 Tax=Burkholderia cenocepacia TaxID=95486 RepID=UPI001B9A7DCE
AVRVRLEISNEPVCYPVRRAIYAGAWITCCSTASPTKMRTGSVEPFPTGIALRLPACTLRATASRPSFLLVNTNKKPHFAPDALSAECLHSSSRSDTRVA